MIALCEMLCLFFLGAGFVVEGNPLFNLMAFFIGAVFAFICIILEDNRERNKRK